MRRGRKEGWGGEQQARARLASHTMASRFDAADARPDFLTIRGWDKPAFDSAGLVDAVRHLEHIEDVVEYALDSEEFAEARLARGPDAYGAPHRTPLRAAAFRGRPPDLRRDRAPLKSRLLRAMQASAWARSRRSTSTRSRTSATPSSPSSACSTLPSTGAAPAPRRRSKRAPRSARPLPPAPAPYAFCALCSLHRARWRAARRPGSTESELASTLSRGWRPGSGGRQQQT